MKRTTRWLLFFVVKALCLASTPLFGQETTVPLKQQDMIQLDPIVKPRHVTRPLRNMNAQTVSTQPSTGTTVPMWSAVATLGSNRYNIRMVGTSVFTAGTTQTTTVIAPLSHEVAEWVDDPTGDNPTPPWGNIGQVAGCQNNLENGDALSGSNRVLTLFGYNYHVQELVFVGWFYHLNPSLGVNNWYSNFGTFRGFARPCPPGGTN